MKHDEIIEEVRSIRKKIDSTFASDDEYYRHLLEIQDRYKARLVTRSPQPWPPDKGEVRKIAEPSPNWDASERKQEDSKKNEG